MFGEKKFNERDKDIICCFVIVVWERNVRYKTYDLVIDFYVN